MDSLDSAEWYTQWCEPIVWALYHRDTAAIKRLIKAARNAVETGALDSCDRWCLKYQVAYLEYQAQRILVGPEWKSMDIIQRFLDELLEQCDEHRAENLRRRLYLQLRIRLDRIKLMELNPAEMNNLLDNLSSDEHTIEVWIYIGGWAFVKDQRDILEMAYEFALTNKHGFQSVWHWHRIDTMWKIATGKATEETITRLVDAARIPNQIRSLVPDILPKAREMGIIDEKLDRYIEARTKEIADNSQKSINKLLSSHTRNREIHDPSTQHQSAPE